MIEQDPNGSGQSEFRLPSRLPAAVLFALFSAVAAGAWYVSAQNAAIVSLGTRFEDFKNDMQQRNALVYSIDTRLTRIEATLAQLVKAQTPPLDANHKTLP